MFRRTFLALAALAFGLFVTTAGAAVAESAGPRGGRAGTQVVAASSERGVAASGRGEHARAAGVVRPGVAGAPIRAIHQGDHHVSGTPAAGPSAMAGSPGTPTGAPTGGVTRASAGSPAPVEAPVAAANGPAPVAAATAPNPSARFGLARASSNALNDAPVPVPPPAASPAARPAARPAATVDPSPAATPAATVDPTAIPSPEASGAPAPDLSALGTLGLLAPPIPDGPAAVRSVLTTTTGRSVVTIIAVLLAMLVFLSVHRRLDRNDPKLASANAQADVARFL